MSTDLNLPIDPVKVDKIVRADPLIEQITKQAATLLRNTERPNIITYDEFFPYMEMYNGDHDKQDENHPSFDRAYRARLATMFLEFRRNLNINIYQPIIVIRSKEDPTNLYFFPPIMRRISPDNEMRGGLRNAVGAATRGGPGTRREDQILDASIKDIYAANEQPEAIRKLQLARGINALLAKKFIDHNMAPEKRDALYAKFQAEQAGASGAPLQITQSGGVDDVELDDEW